MGINNCSIKLAVIAVFAVVSILGGCGKQPTGGVMPTPEVTVVTIQPQQLVTTTELSGRTSANLVAEVRPQVGGIIQKRLFTEGSDVKAGQVLFQIDPSMYQAALDNAKAALARSEANLSAIRLKSERIRELLAEKAVSKQDYDDAAAALKQVQADIQYAKATVETARINLRYTAITAPISGRIGKSNITEGALVTAHQPNALATIQQMDPMYVDVTQSTAELLKLQRRMAEGQLQRNGALQNKVRLILEDNYVYPGEGTFQFRDVTVDPTTGSVILRIVVPNPKGVLLPGMFVRTIVQEGVNKEALLVPQQAVFRDPKGNAFTLIVDSGEKVVQRPLTLDRAVDDKWFVSSGLAKGDRVIVEGALKVRPGVSVKAIPLETGEKTNGKVDKEVPSAKRIDGGK